jgi:hypothetical protein
MRPEDLKALRDQQPFVPFRIVFTDGRSFDIPHRDFLMITKHTVEIALAPDAATGLPEKIVHGSPLHIVRVELLQPTASAA